MLAKAIWVLVSLLNCLRQELILPLITQAKLSVAAMLVLDWRLPAMVSVWKEHELAVLWMDRRLVCSLGRLTIVVLLAQKEPTALSQDSEL